MAKFGYNYEGRVMRDNARAGADQQEVGEALEAHEHDAAEYRATRERKASAIARIRQGREAQHEEAVFVNWLMARSI